MSYAMLAFERCTIEERVLTKGDVEITVVGDRWQAEMSRLEDEARAELAAADLANDAARAEWMRSVGGPDGGVYVSAGPFGGTSLSKEAATRFPRPVKAVVSCGPRVLRRTWRAELFVDGASLAIATPPDVDGAWGLPVDWVLAELEALERQGWTVLHVSEDRGIYAGRDCPEEALPTRVRYLLRA